MLSTCSNLFTNTHRRWKQGHAYEIKYTQIHMWPCRFFISLFLNIFHIFRSKYNITQQRIKQKEKKKTQKYHAQLYIQHIRAFTHIIEHTHIHTPYEHSLVSLMPCRIRDNELNFVILKSTVHTKTEPTTQKRTLDTNSFRLVKYIEKETD